MAQGDKFHIHVNRELRDRTGKPMKFYSEKDYTSELKKRGMEPFRQTEKSTSPAPYTLSRDSREMIRQAGEYQRRGQKPGTRFIEAINKLGVTRTPDEIRKSRSGGFYAS